MSFFTRLRLILTGKANKALDAAEDPADTLDLAYNREVANAQRLRESIADIVTAQNRVRIQREQMDRAHSRLEDTARRALEQEREAVAVSALTQAELIAAQLGSLVAQDESLAGQRQSLEDAGQRLQVKLAQMRTEKETLKVQYQAAKARVRAGEAAAGLGRDDAELREMLDRAREKILSTQARAEAIGQLMDSGTFAEPADIEARVAQRSVSDAVEVRIAEMKKSLGAPSSPPRIVGGEGAAEVDKTAS
ncbi:MAG TPA: PspA/IM30 family protein [Candidatus Dormibacteraeota bacterium]|jgi:phage shock protein A|nr:PspA/IM30 family protein [Candidatus Dormibacteraeota bacterium]